VEAGALAVGDVRVQRQLARDRVVVAAPGDVAEILLAEALGEMRGGGIGGVTRSRPVVAAQQARVEAPGAQRLDGGRGRVHGAEVSTGRRPGALTGIKPSPAGGQFVPSVPGAR